MHLTVTLAGTGVAVPARVLAADELDCRLGLAPGESFRITGIRRRHTAVGETASQLAAGALRDALDSAGMSWEEMDCLICASGTMDQALPYNAAMVLAEMPETRSRRKASLDIGASCLSFLQAVDLAACAMAAGRYRNVAIVSADITSFSTDCRNLRENGIFGDGAAAAILRPSRANEPSRILATRSRTFPEGVDFCQMRSGGSRFHRRGSLAHAEALFEMRGRPLFALVARELPRFVEELLGESGLSRDEIDWFIPHQASRQALDHVIKRLGFDDGRAVDVFAEFGNQVAAALPTALHFAVSRHGMKRGDKALLLGTGAGVSIGGMVLIY